MGQEATKLMVPYGDVSNRIYCASAILLPPSPVITVRQIARCTTQEQFWNEEEIRYVSPDTRGHYNVAATVLIIGLAQ